MARAFPEKTGCDVPATEALEVIPLENCDVPESPDTAFMLGIFARSIRMGGMPQPSKKTNENAITGFMMAGVVTAVQEGTSPDWDHQYKCRDCHGALTIDVFTTPINDWLRVPGVRSVPAEVDHLCLVGYWCNVKVCVVWETPGMPIKWGTVKEVPCHENYVYVHPDESLVLADRVKLILHYPDTDTVPKKQIYVDDNIPYWETSPVVNNLGQGIAINPDIDGTSFNDDPQAQVHLITPKMHHIEWKNLHDGRKDFQFDAADALDCPPGHMLTTLEAEWLGIDILWYGGTFTGIRQLHLPQPWVEVTREVGQTIKATIEWHIVGDENWIHVAEENGVTELIISHTHPYDDGTETSSLEVLTGATFDDGTRVLTIPRSKLRWDEHGHERAPEELADLTVTIPGGAGGDLTVNEIVQDGSDPGGDETTVTPVTTLNFEDGLEVTDDGEGSATVGFPPVPSGEEDQNWVWSWRAAQQNYGWDVPRFTAIPEE